jgi:hypothetical protein
LVFCCPHTTTRDKKQRQLSPKTGNAVD